MDVAVDVDVDVVLPRSVGFPKSGLLLRVFLGILLGALISELPLACVHIYRYIHMRVCGVSIVFACTQADHVLHLRGLCCKLGVGRVWLVLCLHVVFILAD